jgi:hypothetical protein
MITEAYRRLGTENMEDDMFDVEFGKEIKEKLEYYQHGKKRTG